MRDIIHTQNLKQGTWTHQCSVWLELN